MSSKVLLSANGTSFIVMLSSSGYRPQGATFRKIRLGLFPTSPNQRSPEIFMDGGRAGKPLAIRYEVHGTQDSPPSLEVCVIIDSSFRYPDHMDIEIESQVSQ